MINTKARKQNAAVSFVPQLSGLFLLALVVCVGLKSLQGTQWAAHQLALAVGLIIGLGATLGALILASMGEECPTFRPTLIQRIKGAINKIL